jgi:hypothetical protein
MKIHDKHSTSTGQGGVLKRPSGLLMQKRPAKMTEGVFKTGPVRLVGRYLEILKTATRRPNIPFPITHAGVFVVPFHLF